MRRPHIGIVGFCLIFVLAILLEGLGDGASRRGDADISRRWPDPGSPAQIRRPPPSHPSDRLPPISASDPAVKIMPGAKGNSTGTAFSIGDGVWMTARHVLRHCQRFGIVAGRKTVEMGFDAVLSPRHDLAVFRTERSAPALGFASAAMRRGQGGYHFGYPQGRAAEVYSTLLGRMNIIPANGERRREPVVAWAENIRHPRFSGALGGISGGPVVDAEGTVIGVTVAGSQRRGRIYTTAPAGLRDILQQVRIAVPGKDRARQADIIGTDTFQSVGRALRHDLTVVKVLCWAT